MFPVASHAQTTDRDALVQQLVAVLMLQVQALQAQLAELKQSDRDAARSERDRVVPYFEVTNHAEGTVDGSKEFTLAELTVTARSKDLDATKFTSGSYVFREVQLIRANHPATTVEKTFAPVSQVCSSSDDLIPEGKSKTCKIKMSPLPPGDYQYVIKNPSIGNAKTEMILEGSIKIR